VKQLLKQIRQCQECLPNLPHGVNPILAASPKSKFAIIGQAPGSIVHRTGIPWDDKSGDNLREWLGIDKDQFYNADEFAIIPMGFCYPGRGKTGDLPPRKECAPQWHKSLFDRLKKIELTLLIGKYAQDYYLGKKSKRTLTETVMHFEEYLPKYFVLPHPSPRNNIWMAKNDWFKKDVLPILKSTTAKIISN